MLIISLDHARKLGLVLLVTFSTLAISGIDSAPSYQLSKRSLQPPVINVDLSASASLDLPQPGFYANGQPAADFKATGHRDDFDDLADFADFDDIDVNDQQQPEDDEFEPVVEEEFEDEREGAVMVINKATKQPDTPPKSLPSDPYALYTYEKPYAPAPGSLQPGKKARQTFIVGDVHGSLVGLNGFLKQVKFDAKQDEIIFAGDLVAKGPQSLEVIDKAREIQARCVRGNHDDKVLRWKGFLDSKKKSIPSDLVPNSEHHKIAKKMSKEQYEYLLSCPLILTVPKELSANKIPIHVVHAGIDPSDNISKQLPWVLVNVRNILKDGTPSRKKKKGEGWAQLFNDFHTKRVKQGEPDFLIVYGHDAGRSLNVKKWSIGLDTGCVYGRKLSAYVVETGEVHSVKCPDLGLDSDED
ncbi:hypothetical protein BG015_004672 [Linnemannia schmuckeri]|uniref:Calcineurin-like phosphoesterase domain-containing protein n=1 Tax=Linnemannia schmuckeri TaxID=64567 RepID=A0A9P5S3U5_9FUNG|nr:hypothetical protein BG015_004672 [Linnemannia schmuckeri]